MKSIRIDSDQKKSEYPILMEWVGAGHESRPYVALFSSEGAGTVVWSDNDDWNIGDYSVSFSASQFQPFSGNIELSNSISILDRAEKP